MKHPIIKSIRKIESNTHYRTIFKSGGSFYINLPMRYIKNNAIQEGDKVEFEEPIDSMDGELLIRRVFDPKENEKNE